MKTHSTLDISSEQPHQSRPEAPSGQADRQEAFSDYSRKINRSLYNLLMLTNSLANHLSYSSRPDKTEL